MRWGKKRKYRSVGKECRITRCPVSIWSVFVCLSVKMVYFFCLSVRYCQVARSSVTLGANVLRLGGGGDLNHKCLYEAHTSNLRKTLIRSTKPPLLPNRCYRLAFLSVVGYNHFYVFRCCHLSIVFCQACVSGVLFFF